MSPKWWFKLVHILPPKLVFFCAVHVSSVASLELGHEEIEMDDAINAYKHKYKIEV